MRMRTLLNTSLEPSKWVGAATTLAVIIVGACGGDDPVTPSDVGSIQALVTTTGTALDPDGYTVLVDGENARAVGVNGSVTIAGLQPGAHEVSLTGLSANCSVADNPRSVSVAAGAITDTAFEVVCAALVGDLGVLTVTTGVNIDPDGYAFTIDGGPGQAIGVNATLTVQATSGDRSVELTDVAANCSVAGDNPRTVTVPANQLASTTFEISCVPIVNDLEVVTITTGQDLDPDGYTFTVDGGTPEVLGINDSLTVSAQAGDRSVELLGIANNCSVASTNPRTVNVPTSGSARVEFIIGCTSATGSLVATTTTTGVDMDPDGYIVTVDGGINEPIAINATVSINSVPAGSRTVELTGLANNCSVSGQNPRAVTVPSGGAIQTDFFINCVPITGTVDVTTTTTGVDIDPNGYTVQVETVANQAIDVNDMISVEGVVWGDRSVELLNLESNCSVNGQNPRTVTVPQEGTVETTFDVTCVALTGNLTVTASTTGGDLDPDGYTVSVDGGPGEALPTNGAFAFSDVVTGDRSVLLTGIAPNCMVTGDNPATVTVPSVGTAEHTFDIVCAVVVGDVEVTTSTTGSQLDPDGYSVEVEGESPVAMLVNDMVTVEGVSVGDRTVELTGVAPNCVVSGDNPRTVTVTDGGTVSTTFDVTCEVALSNQIVFDTNRDGNSEIYVMNPAGGGLQRLTNQAARDAEPYVSPTGTKIVFVASRDGNKEIYVMDADGTDQTRLTNHADEDSEPAFSPDGTKIVFSSDRDGDSDVYVMNADGSGVVQLTNVAGRDGLAQWSPDGTKIVFSSERGGDLDIWVMNADGSSPQQLTNNAGLDFAPAYSPDGTKIAFTSEQDGDREIFVMNANGTGQTNLTSNTDADLAPQWSPDGSQIAFASDRDGNTEVYVMNANGSGQTNITNNGAVDFEVSWSP